MMLTHRRHGFLLIQLIFVVALVALLGTVLGRVVVGTLQLQRTAVQHANAIATTDALIKRIQSDVLEADAARFERRVLTLVTRRAGKPVEIGYQFDADAVQRTLADGALHAWRSPRLRFEANLENGRAGRLLWLTVVEQAVPPTPTARARTYRFSVVLPPESAEARR